MVILLRCDLQRQWRFRARNGEDGEDGEDVEREHEGDEEERRKTGDAIQHVFILMLLNWISCLESFG